MNRFIPIFLVMIASFVFGNNQLSFAQVQILDGDGQQVTPNVIPADGMNEIESGTLLEGSVPQAEFPETGPQVFGGNGSSIIIRKSSTSVDENGERTTESSGKVIVVGPDGKRQEFDLNEGENQPLIRGGIQIEGRAPRPAPNQQAQSFSLGLQCQPIHPAVASQLNLEKGLMVSQVSPDSPAAAAGVRQHDVLLFTDEKQLTNQADLSRAVQTAGEADADILLTLVRGGKEMSVTVKPEKRLANQQNRDLMAPGRINGMPQIIFPEFDADGLFGEDALGNGMEARMRLQMEQMEERMRRMQRQLGEGLIEMPRLPRQFRE